MTNTRALIILVAGCLCTGMASAVPAAAVPIGPIGSAADRLLNVTPASFWGQPFPYGYRYRHDPCFRTERVRTPRRVASRVAHYSRRCLGCQKSAGCRPPRG